MFLPIALACAHTGSQRNRQDVHRCLASPVARAKHITATQAAALYGVTVSHDATQLVIIRDVSTSPKTLPAMQTGGCTLWRYCQVLVLQLPT